MNEGTRELGIWVDRVDAGVVTMGFSVCPRISRMKILNNKDDLTQN